MSWTYAKQLSVQELQQSAKPVLIFKHSNRCSISAMAFNRVQKEENQLNEVFHFYLIDVVADRPLSLYLADVLNIEHESPQVIVLNQGKVIHTASHMAINPQTLLSLV